MTDILRLTRVGYDGNRYVDLELTKPELQALGHVAAQWAYLEFLIFEHSEGLADQLGIALPDDARSDSLRKRVQAWRSLSTQVEKAHPPYGKRVLAITKRVGSAMGERHKLIHGRYEWHRGKKRTLEVFSHKNPNEVAWRINRSRIELFAYKLAVLNYDFMAVGGTPETVHDASRRIPDRRGHLRSRLEIEGPGPHPTSRPKRKRPR